MASRYRAFRAAFSADGPYRSPARLFPCGRSWFFLPVRFLFPAREVKGHVDMFLDIAESLFLEETYRRLVVGGGVDDDHPHPLFLHAAFDLLEQAAPHATLLDIPADPQPDQVAVFPGRVVLLHRGPEGKPEDF